MSKVSIVVVSLVGGNSLKSHIESLGNFDAEKIVLLDSSKNDINKLKSEYTSIQFVNKNGLSVPMARKQGVDLAVGDVVALLEDTSLPSSEWLGSIITAFAQQGVVAVGGPVILSQNLSGNFLALGCGEYGRFHPTTYGSSGSSNVKNNLVSVDRLPGNNLAYRREALLETLAESEDGLIEGAINEKLKQQGKKLFMHPKMLVTYAMRDEHGASLKTRFNHGRLFAGNRVAGQSWSTRLTWWLKSTLLPVVLTLRGCSSMTHSVNMTAWPKVALWIFLMETSWAVGEGIGYLLGVGRSMEAWK